MSLKTLSASVIGFTLLAGLLPLAASAATSTSATLNAPVSASGASTVLSGTADSKTVSVFIHSTSVKGSGVTVYSNKNLKVKSGKWELSLPVTLANGTYSVEVYGATITPDPLVTGMLSLGSGTSALTTTGTSGSAKTVLAQNTFTVSASPSSSAVAASLPVGGSLSVSSLPLLTGGTAVPGSSVPVAYLKVVNRGTTAASFTGVTLKQNGSATSQSIVGFATSDDKGGSLATIGGTEGSIVFKNGSTLVPLSAIVAPGQVRIFTIKALISKQSGSSAGKTIMLDTQSLDSSANITAAFPIRGVTWTLTR